MTQHIPEIPRGGIVVVFDGWCGPCTWAAGFLLRKDRRARLRVVASQVPGVRERFRLSADEAASAAWAFDSRGGRFRGAAAINHALDVALGVCLFHPMYRIPGMRQLQDACYAWIANHRRVLPSASPWCRTHPGACAHPE